MSSERIIFIGLAGELGHGVIDADEHIAQQYCFSTVAASDLTAEFLRHEVDGGAGGFVAIVKDEHDAALIHEHGGMIIHVRRRGEPIEGAGFVGFKPWLDYAVVNDGDERDFFSRIEVAVGTQIKRVQQAAKQQ